MHKCLYDSVHVHVETTHKPLFHINFDVVPPTVRHNQPLVFSYAGISVIAANPKAVELVLMGCKQASGDSEKHNSAILVRKQSLVTSRPVFTEHLKLFST